MLATPMRSGSWPTALSEGPALPFGPRELAVTLLLGSALFALSVRGGPIGSTVGGADLYAMYLAKHRYIAETYRAGRLPLWNPYEYAGLPLHGTSQGSALYPPVVLANLVFDPETSLQLLFWLHITVFTTLFVAYLRRCGVGLLPACLGALLAVAWFFEAAGGAATNQPHYLFEFTWVPGILLAWHELVRGRRGAALLLPLLVCVQWLPGYPEFPIDTAVLLGCIALLGPGPTLWRRALAVVGLVALGALLAGVQLVPLAEATRESARLGWLGGFARTRQFFAFDSFGSLGRLFGWFGAAGLVCLAIGASTPSPLRRGWLAAFLLALFATTWPLSVMYSFYPYKLLRFAWGWIHLAPLFAALLAALAIDRVRTRHGRLPTLLALGVALLAWLVSPGWAVVVALACAISLWPPLGVRGAWLVPAALAALHGGLLLSDITARRPFAAPDLEAEQPRAALLRELQRELPDQPRVFGVPEYLAGSFLAERLPSPYGHEAAVPPGRMDRLLRELRLHEFFRLKRAGRREREDIWSAVADHPGMASALGLGLLVLPRDEGGALLAAGYQVVATLPDGDAVFYRRPMPRVSIVHSVSVAADEQESFRQVAARGFDPTRTVVLEEEPGLSPRPPAADAVEGAEIVAETPEHVQVRARLAAPGILVLRDNQYPGWRVDVDGAPVRNLTANFSFRGVALPAGTHEVEWSYAPRSVRLGALVSGIGLVLLGGLRLAAARARA